MSGLQCLLEGKSEAETDDCYVSQVYIFVVVVECRSANQSNRNGSWVSRSS